MKVEEAKIPEELVQYFREKGIVELYPPQEQAIQAGLLAGRSMVVSAPTAAGKTFLALVAAYLKAKQGKKVVYLAPLRALASEKYAEFSEFRRFGMTTTISTGDYDSTGEFLGRSDIVVLTNERFDSVMRHKVSWINSVGLFIADEVHLAGNDNRGPTLEMILTKALHLGLDAQLLALSATISNARELAEWLHAVLVEMDWRPVPLREGVYDYGGIVFSDGERKQIPRSTYGPPIDVAMDTVKGGGQSLVFANTRRRAVSLATRASELTQRSLTPEERKAASEASRRILTSGEETSLGRLLAEVVAKGSAFHHAGLESEHRKIVEDYYRARAIKVLAATPTLCLPAGEEIFGDQTPVQVQELQAGDRVLTHGRRFVRIVGPTSRNYQGLLLTVTPWFQLPMSMTPEHRVLKVTRAGHPSVSKNASRRRRTCSAPAWTEARNLKPGDMVLFPRIRDEVDVPLFTMPKTGPERDQIAVAVEDRLPSEVDGIDLTPRSLEQLGMYVAEGSSGEHGRVDFAFGAHETELASLTKAWFVGLGLAPRAIGATQRRRVVYAHSERLAALLGEKFGRRAADKRVPQEIMLLPVERLSHFVRGLWRRDIAKTGPRVAEFDTTSRALAKQLFAALVKMGYMPGLRAGRTVGAASGQELYTVSISGKQYRRFAESVLLKPKGRAGMDRGLDRGYIDDDFYYMPIRRIAAEQYTGTVHNLEVEGDSSYVGSFVVHNSAGVNLPARRVVVADMTRYDAERGGNAEISVLEYRQMAGRAGRPQYDDHGETVMIPPPSAPAGEFLDHYTREPPEPIRSRLSDESAMRSHCLATIATGTGMSKADLESLFGKTLLAKQVGGKEVTRLIEKAMGYLLAERLVESQGGVLYATEFGRRVSILYVDPVTGVLFRDSVRRAEPGRTYTAGILHLVASSPDFEPKFPLRSKDYDQAMAFMEEHSSEMLEKHTSRAFADYDQFLQDMRSVMALHGWIDEWREEQLLTRLGVEPGDMHRAVDNADWLLHALGEIARLFKVPDMVRQADLLRRRVASGVSRELVELTTIQGVGRVRARALYTAGFKTLEDLKEAPADKLAAVDKIGTAVARKIKEQVSRS